MGIERIPVHNVQNACATGSTALHLAVNNVRSGESDVALAVGVEKMNIGDQQRTLSVFHGGYDRSDLEGLMRDMVLLGGEVEDDDAGHRSIFMDVYAAMARHHMNTYGTTVAQIAEVASKNHDHAADNPRAHYRKPMSVDVVLGARKLNYPLTVPMCAPATDGAAAVVVCNDDGLRRLRARGTVQVLASSIGTGVDRDITTYDDYITSHVANLAYERAGVGPSDVDVVEVHDATAFAEILQTELLGLFGPGDGGPAAERGDTRIGGRIPVNPSGGLESKGHPIGATGLGQVFELTDQLRGTAGSRQVSGARIALAENGGGFHRGEEAVMSVLILGGA
jgi:acetyl-CoA acetyltransferase